MKERRKEAGTVGLFLSKVSLAKNKASLGRQYTGETGSYWTVIDCTLGKSGSLAPCQCKHPQISARQNSISPTFAKCFFLFLFFSRGRTPEDETIEKAQRVDCWNHANVIWPEEIQFNQSCNRLCCQAEIKKQKRRKKKMHAAIVRLILLPLVHPHMLFKL